MKLTDSLLTFNNPSPESIPKIPLYMDQLLDYLNSELSNAYEDSTYTKTMINNYVKGKVIEAPIKKKYSQSAIFDLILMFHMKSCFSIQHASAAIDFMKDATDNNGLLAYKKFLEVFEARQQQIKTELSTAEVNENLLLEYIVDISIKKRLVDMILTGDDK